MSTQLHETGFASDYNEFFVGGRRRRRQVGRRRAQYNPPVLANRLLGTRLPLYTGRSLWENTAAGSEDFHAKTPKPATGASTPPPGFIDQTDGVTSPSIDAADPLESYAIEPFP